MPGDDEPVIRPLDRPGDLGWVVMAHGELYAREFDWDADFEALVARIVCVREDATTAKLRILLVDPAARGHRLGTRLVDTCLEFARAAGYRRITLWTNDVLVSARRIYEAAGFELVASEPHHSFGHDLVGQNWSRELSLSRRAGPADA